MVYIDYIVGKHLKQIQEKVQNEKPKALFTSLIICQARGVRRVQVLAIVDLIGGMSKMLALRWLY